MQDIIDLKRLGFSDAEVEAEFAKKGTPLRLTDADVKALKKAGVGDDLIAFLQKPAQVPAPSKRAPMAGGEPPAAGGDKAGSSLRALAERGDANAQYKLGLTYYQGRGVAKNFSEAAKWHRKAAEQGHAKAQASLGFMYETGKGLGQDYAKALKWYREAAKQGHAIARSNLGLMYQAGRGVAKDFVLAHMWYTLAESAGDEPARKHRDRLEKRMTPDQIREARSLARKWRPGAAERSMGWLRHQFLVGLDSKEKWRGSLDIRGYVLKNRQDPNSVKLFWTTPEAALVGRRIVSVKVQAGFGEGRVTSGAGLLYAYDPEKRFFFAYVLEDKRTVTLYRWRPRGLARTMSVSNDRVKTEGFNELMIIERGGRRFDLYLNGSRIGSFKSREVGKGAVGIVAMGTGRFLFSEFYESARGREPTSGRSPGSGRYPMPSPSARTPSRRELVGAWAATLKDQAGAPIGEMVVQFFPSGDYTATSVIRGERKQSSGYVWAEGDNLIIREKGGDRPYGLKLRGERLVVDMPEYGGELTFARRG
ncbi:MAG: tetratricopeptide repeat protein [Nitrospinota bacterium]